jgi:type I restriction enzyme S subunit
MNNTPKLRFPEFSGEWEEKRIDSIFDEIKEKNHPSEEVLTIIQGTGTVPRKESGRNIIYDEKSLSNYKFVQKDDFIIHLRSFEGGLEIANSNGIVSPAYIIMHPKLSIASKFYYSYFRSYKFINHVLPVSVEGVRDGRQIKYPILKEEKIPFTSFAEQQKIADFLSNVDSIITAETKILNTLQKKKKALMQKLFTQQLRFKSADGTDFPAWEEKKLGECVISISSGKNKQKDSAGNYPVYGSMGIIGYSEQYVYNKDCILVARVGANAGTLHIAKGKYDVSDNTLIIELNENELLSFYYYLLVNINLNKLNYGTGQPLVTSGMLKNIDIQLPCKAEQQKIADCLSSIDSLIQTQQKVVTTWQQRKKALLQQMFI